MDMDLNPRVVNIDASCNVIPPKAGIQFFESVWTPAFRNGLVASLRVVGVTIF
jgi:hypothetical protein